MGQTLEKGLIDAGAYERVIIRRTTWDGCACEQEYGPDGDRHITPSIEFAYQPGISRKYTFRGNRIAYRPKPYGGDDFTCLIAEYVEDLTPRTEE